MTRTKYFGRWFAAGVGALALSGSGSATASTQPSEPPSDTATTGDTTAASDSVAVGDTTAGAAVSECPTMPAAADTSVPGTAETAEPATSDAAAGGETTPAAGTAADEDASGSGPETAVGGSLPEVTAGMMPPEGTDVVMMPAFVQVAESEQFGEILVDGQCRALYAFTQDVEGEPTCIEDCAAAWPPLLVEDESATWFAEELDAELFSTVEHPDGQQGKIGDWPLYYFARDMAAGDLNGQGVGDVWWLVAPDGTLIDGGAGASTASGSSMPADGSMPLDTAVATTTS